MHDSHEFMHALCLRWVNELIITDISLSYYTHELPTNFSFYHSIIYRIYVTLVLILFLWSLFAFAFMAEQSNGWRWHSFLSLSLLLYNRLVTSLTGEKKFWIHNCSISYKLHDDPSSKVHSGINHKTVHISYQHRGTSRQ